MEVITTYCFAKSFDAINFPNFQHPMIISHGSSSFILFVIKHFPFLTPCILGMPHWLLLSPNSWAFKKYMATLGAQIEKIVANLTILENKEHVTIYHHLLGRDIGTKYQRKCYEMNLQFWDRHSGKCVYDWDLPLVEQLGAERQIGFQVDSCLARLGSPLISRNCLTL